MLKFHLADWQLDEEKRLLLNKSIEEVLCCALECKLVENQQGLTNVDIDLNIDIGFKRLSLRN